MIIFINRTQQKLLCSFWYCETCTTSGLRPKSIQRAEFVGKKTIMVMLIRLLLLLGSVLIVFCSQMFCARTWCAENSQILDATQNPARSHFSSISFMPSPVDSVFTLLCTSMSVGVFHECASMQKIKQCRHTHTHTHLMPCVIYMCISWLA